MGLVVLSIDSIRCMGSIVSPDLSVIEEERSAMKTINDPLMRAVALTDAIVAAADDI